MDAPEIYRDPIHDNAIIEFAPGLRLTLPLTFFAKYGTLQVDWEEVGPVIEELLSIITLGPLEGPGVTLKEVLEFDGAR